MRKPIRAYFEGEENVFVFRHISNLFGRKKTAANKVVFPEKKKLVFSERRKLGAMFEKWAEENGVAKKPESVVAYLQVVGVLDSEKAREAIKNEQTRND